MIKIAHPIPPHRPSALKRLKLARRLGLTFKPSPTLHPASRCYLLPVNEMAKSLKVEPADLRALLATIGLSVLPGDFVLEPDTTLALRTAVGTRA